MKRRLLSLLMAVSLLLGMAPNAFAASDITGHWAETFINYLNDEGVYKPSASTGKFEPSRAMTRAEFMRYVNRAFHFTETAAISYSDVKPTAWYYETVQIAAKYGYITGTGADKMDPEGMITREQAATIIGRLYKAEPGDVTPDQLNFTDKESIGTWSAGYIKAAVDEGVLAGYVDGSFQPKKVVTRAEVAKILYYYLGTSLSTTGRAYTGAAIKSDTQNATISESCTLSDATIKGDLYITEGVGTSAVTLTNVRVEGNIIVSGGTVTMTNTVADNMIIASPMSRLLQVTATGETQVKKTVVTSAATLYERGLTAGSEGFVDITVDGDSSVSLTLDAMVASLKLESDSVISTTAESTIYRLTANHSSTISGYGSIYQADINANSVSIAKEVSVAGYTVASGVSASIGGQAVTGSSAAGVSPTKIEVDLNNLSKLGNGVDIALPADTKVTGATCGATTLAANTHYIEIGAGIRVLTSYLGTLERGEHTLVLTLSDGKRATIAITVSNTNVTADAVDVNFDRYFRAGTFNDVAVRVATANTQSDIRSVVLGMTALPFSFDQSTRNVVLRRGTLAQLRAGLYTLTIDLANGQQLLVRLNITDSAPAGVTAPVAEYDTYSPSDLEFPLTLGSLTVKSVTTIQNQATQTLEQGTDYELGTGTITLKQQTLEKFRLAHGYVEYMVTLSNNTSVTLVVDYVTTQ